MGEGGGDHVLIHCSIQPALGPSKVVYIIYINENPRHFGEPVLPLLMGLNLRAVVSFKFASGWANQSRFLNKFEPTGTAQETPDWIRLFHK